MQVPEDKHSWIKPCRAWEQTAMLFHFLWR